MVSRLRVSQCVYDMLNTTQQSDLCLLEFCTCELLIKVIIMKEYKHAVYAHD